MRTTSTLDSVKYIMHLAWPAIIEQILLTAATYVDTAMIGALGYHATAAMAVDAPITWLISGLMTAFGVGYSVQIAHSIGAGNRSHVREISRQALIGSVIFGVVMMLIFFVLSFYLPLWLGADDSILPQTQKYLFFYAAGAPFQMISTVFSAVSRCAGDTKTPMLLNIGANLANIVLNFSLIFESRTIQIFRISLRVFGAGWGVAGAAIATALSYFLAAVGMLFVMLCKNSPIQLDLKGSYRLDRTITRRMLSLGIPVALERITISSGQLLMTGITTGLGNIALSANHIAVTAEAISYLPANGISFAGTTVIGHAVGASKPELSKRNAQILGMLGVLAGLLGGAVLFFFAAPLARLFSDNETVIALSASVLRIVAIAEPMFSLSIVLSGVLRGAGKTGAAFWPVAIGMWCVRITTAMLFVYRMKFGLHGVWFAMVADLIARGEFCIFLVRGVNWKQICCRNEHE